MGKSKTLDAKNMKVLVFTEGTTLMHKKGKGLSRKEIVNQSKKRLSFIFDYANYIPIGNAVKKLKTWKNQGAKIFYLTSRIKKGEIRNIKNVLKKYNFPDRENLLFRKKQEQYKDVAEKLMPDILVEDDCESIGGKQEMTYPAIKKELKAKIKSVVVKEFGGIDHLPDNIFTLLKL